MHRPTLIILGGLPATGKTTVALELSKLTQLSYVRIDSIEQALRNSGEMGAQGVQGAGYKVAYALAGDLLDGRNNVLVECVNPIELTRKSWREVGRTHHSGLLEVELYCSDANEHRSRTESRAASVAGLILPAWEEIANREYEPWNADLRVDTCLFTPKEAAKQILRFVSEVSRAGLTSPRGRQATRRST